jgi:hypothetical protein
MAAQMVDLPTPPLEDAKETIMKTPGNNEGKDKWPNVHLPIWSKIQITKSSLPLGAGTINKIVTPRVRLTKCANGQIYLCADDKIAICIFAHSFGVQARKDNGLE